ncbi:MAG: GGDEF domain-containing response regulator [Candidatus Latescibacteria bacterium]|nr:GGDEF domain-containing response regulator [Candidatus Latescibacterota bacterium]
MMDLQQVSDRTSLRQTAWEYRILIVDDDPLFAKFLKSLLGSDFLLERISHRVLRVEQAGSTKEALSKFKQHYDIVLLDINIPLEEGTPPQRKYGLTVLRAIKKMAPETEVIMISGYGPEVDIIVQAIDEGAFYYLDKPFRNELLAALLTRVIEKKESDRKAWVDGFTGLYNKAFFEFSLKNEIGKFPKGREPARRHLNPVSLILLDFDHLKEYNDQYGHLEGDYVIKKIAAVIKQTTRGSDIVARNGGDEFGILLVGADHANALRRAERIREAVYDYGMEYAKVKQLPMTVSIGVATFPSRLESAEALYKAADDALYASKRSGRNAVHGYAESGELRSFQELVGSEPVEHQTPSVP